MPVVKKFEDALLDVIDDNNVIEGNLSERERHRIMELLIRTKTMTYFEICHDIENAINILMAGRNISRHVKNRKKTLSILENLCLKRILGNRCFYM